MNVLWPMAVFLLLPAARAQFEAASLKPDPGASPVDPADATDRADQDLFVALREQIGLKLSPDKGPVSFLIIDHVERPAAN